MKKVFALCMSLIVLLSVCTPLAVSAEVATVVVPATGSVTLELENYVNEIKSNATTDENGRFTSAFAGKLASARNETKADVGNYSNGNGFFRIINKTTLTSGSAGIYISVNFPAAGEYQIDLVANICQTSHGKHYIEYPVGTTVLSFTSESGYDLVVDGGIDLYRYTGTITVAEAGVTEIFYRTETRNSYWIADCMTITLVETEPPVDPEEPVQVSETEETRIEFENYVNKLLKSDGTSNDAFLVSTKTDVVSIEQRALLSNGDALYKSGLWLDETKATITIPVNFPKAGIYQLTFVGNGEDTGPHHHFDICGQTYTFDKNYGTPIALTGGNLYTYTFGFAVEEAGLQNIVYWTKKRSSRLILDYFSLKLHEMDYQEAPSLPATMETTDTIEVTEKADRKVTITDGKFIWAEDVMTVDAIVEYENRGAKRDIFAVAAQYGADDSMISAVPQTVSVAAGETKTWTISLTTDPAAVKTKFFVWDAKTFAPLAKTPGEIVKTTAGEFIYVDAKSTASVQDGSFATPFKTLTAAQEALRARLAETEQTDVYVILKSGEYVSEDGAALELTQKDCADAKNVIFTSLNADKAKISGKKHLTGTWSVHDSAKNIYVTDVPAGTATRQLYVNGIKATRARSPEDAVSVTNLDQGTTKETFENLGMTTADTSFLNYQYPTELEVWFVQKWRYQSIMVDEITQTSDGKTHFGFTDNAGTWKSLVTMNTPASTPAFFENALELLDEEGEWYLDVHKNKLYYKPRYFENINTADVVIPNSETLLKVTGAPWDPVRNISLFNLDFEYTTWNLPTTRRGLRNNQNATYSFPDGGELMDAAVEMHDVRYITVDNCDFSNIGSMALKMTGAVQNCNVVGNEFSELAGSALALGDVETRDGRNLANPTHEIYSITDNLIANNYIHKVGTEYCSAAAVGIGYVKNTTIRNNEITDAAYSGIHTGWGWAGHEETGTCIENYVIEKNYIHNVMNWRLWDGGGLYTLGGTGGTASNPNLIRENYFEDMKNHYGAIYHDNGSTFWKVTNNVIDQKDYPTHYGQENKTDAARWYFLYSSDSFSNVAENNYSTTTMYTAAGAGTRNQFEQANIYADANWPEEAQKIIDAAGIEPIYQKRFDFDIQSVKMPLMYDVSRGGTTNMSYSLISSKDAICDMSNVDIRVSSANPAIATATTSRITGVSAGTTWITLEMCRRNDDGEVTYYDKHTFRVVVS